MATPYILIYQIKSGSSLEWASKYHFLSTANITPAAAVACADAQRAMQTSQIVYSRWEGFDTVGHKFTEGSLAGVPGTAAGEAMPIHYAILLRLVTATTVKRPSTRFIHGWTESYQNADVLSATWITALAAYNTAMAAVAGYRDSDGLSVTSHVFRRFSHRDRMRKAEG